jgi:hypothetical protein
MQVKAHRGNGGQPMIVVAPAGVEKARVSDVDAAPFRSRCTIQAPDHRGSPALACLIPCLQRVTLLTFTVHAAHLSLPCCSDAND